MRKIVAAIAVSAGAAAIVLAADGIDRRSARAGGVGPFETIELKTYDWRMAHTARPDTAAKDIILVEIDESSLRTLQPFAGRWPWPRVVHSSLIDFLARAKARLIVYDVVFSEPDTRIGFKYGESTWSGEDSDKAFADSIKAAGNVLLLADASYDTQDDASGVTAPDQGYRLDVAGILERNAVLPPFALLADAASGVGHNLFVLDADGPIRHITPFIRTQHRAVPSLGVAAALRAAGISPSDVRLDGTILRMGDRAMPLASKRVNTSAGIETYLWGLINFRGPALLADLESRTYPKYSVFDLLQSEEQLNANEKPTVSPSIFQDKIVFVGTTASGLFDVFQTPFATGNMPGIQVHAAVADDILSNRFMQPPSESVRIAGVVLAAAAIGFASTLLPAWWAAGATAGFVAMFGIIVTRLFASGSWVNVSQPVTTSGLALFGGVAYQYFVEGREKRKMKRLFGRYVSKDVYDQLVSNPGLARLGGQRRLMTVLFSDIRGFTTVSERGQPEEIVGTLNEYFTKMVAIVFKHKGTVDKFVGDMVMALFGAPLDDPEHADHAVDAALDMIDELRRLNKGWKAEGRPELDIGIGINTGPMIAGNVGSEQIMSYTVIGDSVNLGSRLESLNKQYGTRIIISASTREQLSGRYNMRPLGDVVVKGKTQPVAIFEVIERSESVAESEVDV